MPAAADPSRLAADIATAKALKARLGAPGGELVAAFDTIVELDGALLGKPTDLDDAWRMLRALSGRQHQVITGVALLGSDESPPATFAVTTAVRMKRLTDDAIEEWLGRGEALGCAGAYNIEGQVAEVDEYECYQNVAGLPLCHVCVRLREGAPGAPPLAAENPIAKCDAALGRHCRLGPRVFASSAGG